MSTDSTTVLAESALRLVRTIEAQQQVVDAALSRPARWRGPLRREFVRRASDYAARASYAPVFDWLGTVATTRALDEALLHDVHIRLGGDHDYRARGITIGGRRLRNPPAARVPELTRESLRRAADGAEPPPLAAARLQLELLIIHPFFDGNGRTARLMSSYVLMTAGYRSTLLTAVEQHTCYDPASYRRSFLELHASGDDAANWTWLNTSLGAMAVSSQFAAWHRARRSTRAERGTRVAIDRQSRDAMAFQLRRLRAEERDDARSG